MKKSRLGNFLTGSSSGILHSSVWRSKNVNVPFWTNFLQSPEETGSSRARFTSHISILTPREEKRCSYFFQLSNKSRQLVLTELLHDRHLNFDSMKPLLSWHCCKSLEVTGLPAQKKKQTHCFLFTQIFSATSRDNSTSSNEHLPSFLTESTLGCNTQLSAFTQSFWEKIIWGFFQSVDKRLIYSESITDIKGSRSGGCGGGDQPFFLQRSHCLH